MADEDKHFWSTVPGILTGLAAVITALTGLFAILNKDAPAKAAPAPVAETAKASPAATAPEIVPAAQNTKPAAPDIFTLTAVADDADGFTNVRSQKSANSQVVAQVNSGEEFTTFRQDGNWWQVKTRDGKIGFMHLSRIRITTNQ